LKLDSITSTATTNIIAASLKQETTIFKTTSKTSVWERELH
jgi:hypothetical protein